ncbi:hypothetical protein [Salinarimonas ramus]|uniref:Uncharacterized protein n=1 Tax=Salinarimonas ramus TaxID=690164 RepID=A0A917V5D9_9HYPH|nr:hypothetical protein [Salinarimonas ramus]GGK39111.1 hypothetical protein GCM10011322_27720 [Salinarimonas ramus]
MSDDVPPPSRLPPPPDFDALTAAAPSTADRRTEVLALIGHLVFSWSNNESLFIYVLMLLLETDEVSAAIVFATLNTTRARLDLVQRLAKAKLRDPALARELDALVARFSKQTKLRNDLNHCMYTVDEEGVIARTQLMKLEERGGRLSFGRVRAMDRARLDEMAEAVREHGALNRDLWALLPRLEAHLAARATPRRSPPA